MAQELTAARKFRRVCEVEGNAHFLIRKGRNKSRVVACDNVTGEGELVETSKVLNIQEIADETDEAELEADEATEAVADEATEAVAETPAAE